MWFVLSLTFSPPHPPPHHHNHHHDRSIPILMLLEYIWNAILVKNRLQSQSSWVQSTALALRAALLVHTAITRALRSSSPAADYHTPQLELVRHTPQKLARRSSIAGAGPVYSSTGAGAAHETRVCGCWYQKVDFRPVLHRSLDSYPHQRRSPWAPVSRNVLVLHTAPEHHRHTWCTSSAMGQRSENLHNKK